MKIGIITLSASFNCGSLLQSYALKRYLEQYGDVEIINFSSEASHRLYDIVPTFFNKIKMYIYNKKMLKALQKEKNSYKKFQKDFLRLSKKELYAKDLSKIEKYDIIVAGSDQIWNVKMEDFDEAFFCNWTRTKKVAYAPSLGGHDLQESPNYNQIESWIKEFDGLSVREEKGKCCLEKILKKKVVKVLDPTLLYDEADWKKLIGPRIIESDYIFYYSWAYCYRELRELVQERSQKVNLPVYVMDAHKWRSYNYMGHGFYLCKEGGPLAFLNLMYYAKECYVESFHGMIFAYLFKKDFWLLDTHKDINDLDARLQELVNLLGVHNRICTIYNKDHLSLDAKISYADNEILDNMRLLSKRYIQKEMTNT